MIIFLGGYLENNISQYNIYKAEGKEEINLVIGSCDAAFDEPVTERAFIRDCWKNWVRMDRLPLHIMAASLGMWHFMQIRQHTLIYL